MQVYTKKAVAIKVFDTASPLPDFALYQKLWAHKLDSVTKLVEYFADDQYQYLVT